MKLPAADLKPRASKFCLEEWQEIWNSCEGNKLHAIYPVIGNIAHSKRLTRKDAVILNRLRIGHCRLTVYLLLGEYQPTCESCGSPLTLKHLPLECTNLRYVRLKYFNVSTLKELFECVDKHNIIDFIKQTHFYHNL